MSCNSSSSSMSLSNDINSISSTLPSMDILKVYDTVNGLLRVASIFRSYSTMLAKRATEFVNVEILIGVQKSLLQSSSSVA